PFDSPELRRRLVEIKQEQEQTIDTVTQDEVISVGFDEAAKEKAVGLVQTFRDYIEQHKAEIDALQILYSRPYKQRLTEPMLKELEAKLKEPFGSVPVDTVWNAYERVENQQSATNNRQSAVHRFADLIPLVQHALEQQPVLKPFAESDEERFNEWLMDKAQAGTEFTSEQLAWLHLIRKQIATSLSIEPDDFDYAPFAQQGGLGKAAQLFGNDLPALLNELNEALVA
ncbi:MAG TPA: type I restriction-modification enzyme R subunit C-terminal domain-containing protein, partial [Tichowtungia sp.]|nr:type I restriction-modification enzyme R subunit C-terminal domain-containing protein [Tichowtungia sp.]